MELRIDVAGRQFYWEFRYPDGSVTYDTLVVPVDRTVELDVTAPDHDVIHSWWVPALGGKIDAIPGVVNHTWFRAEEAGEYAGTCGEFCGIQHNAMSLTVVAVPRTSTRTSAPASPTAAARTSRRRARSATTSTGRS